MAGVIDPTEALRLYDEQVRAAEDQGLPPAAVVERDGPVLRVTGLHRGFVSTGQDVGVTGAELDALIERQRAVFEARGQAVEWKTRAHDLPTELPGRLLAAGFVPEERETVVVAAVDDLDTGDPPSVEGVRIRETDDPVDMRRIAEMEGLVWGDDHTWLGEELATVVTVVPRLTHVLLAEAERAGGGAAAGDVVSAAWLTLVPGTAFAGLWGGSTLAGWRRRGIYRALVATRARIARRYGVRYLQVDASDDSRPILERLGFVAITTTTPYVWTPPAPGDR